MNRIPEVAIIGGGLAGLFTAIQLAESGFPVTVIEKKTYPFHRVCGEYISNEARAFLSRWNIDPEELGAAEVSRLILTAPGIKPLETHLDPGGFGISRYTFDNRVYESAKNAGATIRTGTTVTDVQFRENAFELELTGNPPLRADIVIGAQGKRSVIDQKLERAFFRRRSPYIGVKYHVRTDQATDVIRLDLFKGGYCGLVKIESDRYCLCYLSHRENLARHHTIEAMEKAVLYENPVLKDIFLNAEFLFDKPEVINEVSFLSKSPVDAHLLMSGDSAGMIAPLCGNGMAMAMHSSEILAGLIIKSGKNALTPARREALEKAYSAAWKKTFSARLRTGRMIQKAFRIPFISGLMIPALRRSAGLSNWLISKTHGKPF